MTRFVSRNPIIFSVLAVLLAVVVIKLLDAGLPYLKPSALANRLMIETVLCGYVILLLTRSVAVVAGGRLQTACNAAQVIGLSLSAIPAYEMSAKRANVQIDVALKTRDRNQTVLTTASAVDARKGIPWR